MSGTIPVLPPPPVGCFIAPSGITPAQFRTDFTGFADNVAYPDAQVQSFLNLGATMCPCDTWLDYSTMGAELVCAHFLTMQQRVATMGAQGAMAFGIATSKSVSKVSVGYDPNLTAMEGWGPWNYTVFGQQFAWLAELVGLAGGREVLAMSNGLDSAGTVQTWALGVQIGWLSGGAFA